MGVVDDAEREAAFFRDVMDPFDRAVLEAEDPWDAYQSIASMRGAMTDYLDWGPHGGEVFVAWADLEDLYDTGKTPLSDAHGALRQAASQWLARPPMPDTGAYVENWIAETARSVSGFVERDGGFWS